MTQAVFPGNNPDVVTALDNIWTAYKALGGEENIQAGVKYLEAHLEMKQALFDKKEEEANNMSKEELIIHQILSSGYHPDVATVLIQQALFDKKKEEAVNIKYKEETLKMSQSVFPDQ